MNTYRVVDCLVKHVLTYYIYINIEAASTNKLENIITAKGIVKSA